MDGNILRADDIESVLPGFLRTSLCRGDNRVLVLDDEFGATVGRGATKNMITGFLQRLRGADSGSERYGKKIPSGARHEQFFRIVRRPKAIRPPCEVALCKGREALAASRCFVTEGFASCIFTSISPPQDGGTSFSASTALSPIMNRYEVTVRVTKRERLAKRAFT